ncbi:MAG: hypothetical protein WBB24_14705 [Maribacter sp.]
MKNIYKTTISAAAISLLMACDADNKVIDDVLADVTTGAVIRTIDEDNGLVYNNLTASFAEGSDYTLVLEEQDEEGGNLLESVEIYVNFRDNSTTEADPTGITTSEVLLQTLSASDFSQGERGLPQTTVSYTSDELVTATGIDESLIIGKDRFEFRVVLTLTNGEIYTNTDVGGPVSGGSYFASPYEYFPVIACSITEDLSGEHSFVATNIVSAPGAGGNCSGNDLSGTVTWTPFLNSSGTVVPGRYVSSDMSFGQYEDCYTTRGPATGTAISIIWDCTQLNSSGSVYLNSAGAVQPARSGFAEEFTYTYDITNVDGADMTIDFSSSSGDRGTVVITRAGGADWPVIFTANNMMVP